MSFLKEIFSRPAGSEWARLLRTARKRSIVLSAAKLALVVGSIPNALNQGGRLLDGLPLSWFQVAVNFLVPYCVSSYSAAHNELRRPGDHPC